MIINQKKTWIFSSGFPERDEHVRQQKAKARLAKLENILSLTNTPTSLVLKPTCTLNEIKSNFTKQRYCQMVEQAKAYILAGDMFEINLSQRFSYHNKNNYDAYHLYLKSRALNPAPFSAFFQGEKTTIASASPERFLHVKNKHVETRPIKGTIARHSDPTLDYLAAQHLQSSEKDRAENIMIVDLMRNDLARVCKSGSVYVPKCCSLESFKTVHHLVSVVKGELKETKTALDLLHAAFPGGSITGAPKVRAMQLIYQLEPNKRGPYCGSLAYLSFNGDLDSSILIRTFAIKDQTICFQAGGAVVLDSNASQEYEESLTKAKALCQALSQEVCYDFNY